MNKIQRATAAIASAAVLAAGLMTMTAAMASATFDRKLSSVIAQVKSEPAYKPIPLSSSSDREWFYQRSEALFEKKISKAQYVEEGNRQFPGYEASFNELADLIAGA